MIPIASTVAANAKWFASERVPRLKAVKVAQTFFCLDAQPHQPICFTSASSARTVAQATPELLQLTKAILNPLDQRPLVMADCEHFNRELVEQVRLDNSFDLLVPMPNQKARQKQYARAPGQSVHSALGRLCHRQAAFWLEQ